MRRKILAALLLGSVMSSPAPAQDLHQAIGQDMPSLMTLYRDLHANPELSMQETRSAARMADEARRAGFTVTTGVGGTGVVAVMANGPGPVLLLRADMDALPVDEQTGLPFASHARGTTREGQATGIMHACGHDTHMTSWVGTARRMAAMRSQWSGTLVMIAQPGEEIGAGARAMLADGLFTRFAKPDYGFALHVGPFPFGYVSYKPGVMNSAADGLEMVGVSPKSNTPSRSLTLSAPNTRIGTPTPARRSTTPSSMSAHASIAAPACSSARATRSEPWP